MKSIQLVVVLACLSMGACHSTPSRETKAVQIWHWQLQGTGEKGKPVRASGTLQTTKTPDADGWYTVQRIKGSRNGIEITGLFQAGKAVPGNIDPSNHRPYAGDNRLRPAGASGQPQLDNDGIQFALEDGSYSNVFYASFLEPPTYLDFHSKPPYPVGDVGPNNERPVQFTAEQQ